MKAVQFTEHGDRSVLTYDEFEDPEPDDDEVLVDVKAAALNHLDVWTRKGLPGVELEMPHIPGSDAAGVVVGVGDDVTRFAEGDHVAVTAGVHCGSCEHCRHGEHSLCDTYHLIGEHTRGVQAEQFVLPEDNLVPVPDDVPWEVAASASLVFQTAWRMLVTQVDLQPGESILVLGASGGVGHACVQIADYLGAEVYATASTDEKLAYAEECGADHVINYKDEDFSKAMYEATGGDGVDAVVDHIGPATWDSSTKVLKKGGRLVTCGATTGPKAETNINRIFWNQLEIYGSTMATLGEVDDVLSLVWEGKMTPRIRETLPMSEIAEAHRLLEDRVGFGKVVVVPDSEL